MPTRRKWAWIASGQYASIAFGGVGGLCNEGPGVGVASCGRAAIIATPPPKAKVAPRRIDLTFPRAEDFREPLWLGSDEIAGKTILRHAEQGFGDTIQYCRYVPLVAARCARGPRRAKAVSPAGERLVAERLWPGGGNRRPRLGAVSVSS